MGWITYRNQGTHSDGEIDIDEKEDASGVCDIEEGMRLDEIEGLPDSLNALEELDGLDDGDVTGEVDRGANPAPVADPEGEKAKESLLARFCRRAMFRDSNIQMRMKAKKYQTEERRATPRRR